MNRFLFFTAFFLSVKIFGCKCENQNIKQSFESADFVFIGEIYSADEFPSGYKTLQNILGRVKIEKIFKLNNDDGYYQNEASLFTSPIRSCDYPFTKKEKFLIFAYIDSDTGFLYSERCLATKELNLVTEEDIKLLEKLSSQFKNDLKSKNTVDPAAYDLLDIPDRTINKLKGELSRSKIENKNLKIAAGSISAVTLVFVILILKRKRG